MEAGDLTIWSLQIFETNAFDVVSRDDVTDRAGARSSRTETASDQALEDVMDTSTVPTFLACGAFFVLSFVMIWAFWYVERLRGANAPHL